MNRKTARLAAGLFWLMILLSNQLFPQSGILAMTPEKNLLVVKHFSQVLGEERIFRIYLPKGKSADARYPVLYVLHGVYCHSEAWPEQTDIDEMAAEYEMILVFPDADNSWYIDSPLKPKMQYESYLVKELIPFIEANFPAKTGKADRAIMGASMGGHGAVTLAAKHPDMFCSVSSFFGILKLTDEESIKSDLIGPFLNDLLGPYKKNKKLWRVNSAYELANKLKNQDIEIFIHWGSTDLTPAKQNSIDFHRRLSELGIPHKWKEDYGGHTSDFLNAGLKEHLDFHAHNLKKN